MTCPACGAAANERYRVPVALNQGKFQTPPRHEIVGRHWVCGRCAVAQWQAQGRKPQ